jgi:hypothetical protein
MANVIRYKTSQPTKRGLRRGNVVVGTGEENYGPTSTTGYVNGITPPDGGYVVYILSSNNDPAIYVANNDNDLVDIANTIGGSVSTIADAKTYLAGRANTWMLNSIPNNTTTDGLIAHIQSNRLSSYPETGTTVYDLSGEGNNGTLQNGTVFNNGVWELDGVDDRVDIADPGYPSSGTDPFSIDITFMVPTGATWYNQGSGTAIIGRGSYAGSLGIFRNSTEGQVNFWARLNGGNIYNPGVTGLARDIYHRVVGTFDGSDTAKIYHNGEYIAQEVNANNAGTFDADQYSIGGNTAFGGNNGGYGGVHIAEAKIYNKALSADEISRNFYGADIPTTGLKIALNTKNVLSFRDDEWRQNLTGLYSNTNLPSSFISHNDLNGDFDGLTEFTYCLWIKHHSTPSGYSFAPFNKYAGTTTAVVRLYHFGDTSGIDDRFGFYMNAGNGWTGYGAYYANPGEVFFLAMQYNSTTGGKVWVNNVPGSRGGRTGTIATNSANFYIYPDNSDQQNSKIREAYVYNTELTDEEVLRIYNSTKAKHGL